MGMRSADIPLSHPHLKHNNRVWVNTYKKGDEYHHKIIIKEAGYTNDVVFKLGQESAGSHNGSSFSLKYEDKDGALVGTVHRTGTKEQPLDKTINNVFKLEGDHLVMTSTIDGVTMKRYYKTRT
ncbi:SAHS10 [Ramazzottius varieornatus]|uniref:SAHS10 n=1 Tax=Ramazzottius varieornatus TaxID=947166 RepID=A0A1D1UJR2_RAMVA|nr:SAHS10 [Ramazzottius varieornatus]